MKTDRNIREELSKPFDDKDIEWRVQQSGSNNNGEWAMVLAYVTNRAIMDRLDDVFGVGGWKNSFEPTPSMDGVMCGISIKFDGEWITKFDGAANTDIEAVKGGLSSAMKRTGVQFGIGRYLYHLESGFANIVEKGTTGAKYAQTKEKKAFYWLPPELPSWALPISIEQLKTINDLVEQKNADTEKMLEFYNLSDVKNATFEMGENIIAGLHKKQNSKYPPPSKATDEDKNQAWSDFESICAMLNVDADEFLADDVDASDSKAVYAEVRKWLKNEQLLKDQLMVFKNT